MTEFIVQLWINRTEFRFSHRQCIESQEKEITTATAGVRDKNAKFYLMTCIFECMFFSLSLNNFQFHLNFFLVWRCLYVISINSETHHSFSTEILAIISKSHFFVKLPKCRQNFNQNNTCVPRIAISFF